MHLLECCVWLSGDFCAVAKVLWLPEGCCAVVRVLWMVAKGWLCSY